jgi:hypothetical protein
MREKGDKDKTDKGNEEFGKEKIRYKRLVGLFVLF